MIRHLVIFFVALFVAFAHPVEEKLWPQNQTFFDYLIKNDIPTTLLLDLEDEEAGAVKTIFAHTAYYEQRHEESGKLIQALIPIGEDIQISLHEQDGAYYVALMPIRYNVVAETLTFNIDTSLQVDLQKLTGNSRVANELASIFDARIDFRRDIRKGDQVSVIYERKVRMGRTWGTVNIKSAFVETNKDRKYAFYRQEDEGYYDEKGHALAGMFLKYPLSAFRRISSGYQPSGRRHPVLGYVRPHLGTDFVAPVGTPVRSVADGVVRFRGCQNGCDKGYGRLVVIQHKNGWETRYAHLRGFARIGQGSRVKQGQVVGYLGGSGLVTGPHLHFEVRKAGRTTNPLALKSVKQKGLQGEELQTFIAQAAEWRTDLDYVALTAQPGVTRLAALVLPSSN